MSKRKAAEGSTERVPMGLSGRPPTVLGEGVVYVPAGRVFCPTTPETKRLRVVTYDPTEPPAELLALLA